MPESPTTHQPSFPRSIRIAGRQIPLRVCLFWGGATLWIGNMFVQTGSFGVTELRASLFFIVELIVVTSATRTIRLGLVARTYCLGGAMMSVMWLVSYVFTSFVPDPDAVSRQFFVPFLEEFLKLAPVLFFLWRGRKSSSWTMSASDVMLLGAASGAGFGLVEEAYFHQAVGPTLALDWFPLTRINGVTLTVGHSTWTALAAATLGFALVWRPRRPILYFLAMSGILWSFLDHSHHNYAIDRRGFTVDFFNFITGHGWLSLYFFVLAALAVIVGDLYVELKVLPPLPELKISASSPLPGNNRATSVWKAVLTKRSLAFAALHYRQGPSSLRNQMSPILRRLIAKLIGYYPDKTNRRVLAQLETTLQVTTPPESPA